MYRKIFVAENEDDLHIKLPENYLNKQVEVIAFEVGDELSPNENEIKDFSDAEAFFDKIRIDMSSFKFDREEANAR